METLHERETSRNNNRTCERCYRPGRFADSGSSPILGVDPGITGGLAFLFANRVVAEDIPTAGGEVDVDTLLALGAPGVFAAEAGHE